MSTGKELKSTSYEIFVGALSVLSILNLIIMLFTSAQDLDYVLLFMNGVLSFFLFLDFLYRLRTAPDRAEYFFRQFGWADLLASVPLQQVKILRVFRIIRVVRLLRQLGPGVIWRTLVHDRANSALYTLLMIGLLMLEFGSVGMLELEAGKPGANIENASDALWYSIVTMATVGYGDRFPVTNPGRLLGSTIIVVGVGIFGTLTGFLATAFIKPSSGSTSPDSSGGHTDSGGPAGAGSARGRHGGRFRQLSGRAGLASPSLVNARRRGRPVGSRATSSSRRSPAAPVDPPPSGA